MGPGGLLRAQLFALPSPRSSSISAGAMEEDTAATQQAHGAALQVTKSEWEAIEDVSQAVRRVGALFQAAALEVISGGPVSEGPPSRGPAVAFDEEAWAFLTTGKKVRAGGGPPPKGERKIDQLRRKRLEASFQSDWARLTEDLAEDRPPRLERFGNRFESFLAASLAWLEQKGRPPVLAATTAMRLQAEAARRYADHPATAVSRMATLMKGAGCQPLKALRELCENEEHLSGAALLDVELSLHEDQREFVALVCGAALRDRPMLLRYQTPPSGGKTSCVALLGACMPPSQRRHLLYACYSRQVRVDVGKHLLASSVPFAIVAHGVASPHNSCYHGRPPRSAPPPASLRERAEWSLRLCLSCDRFPVVLICDLISAQLLLTHRSGGQHLLIFDEPTADVAAGMQADVRRLLRCSPGVTALLSAGVPPFEAMPGFVADFQRRHPGAELRSVACERLPMSVTALDAQERVWAPHHFGVTADEVAGDGHLLRFYSPRVLEQLVATRPEALEFSDLLSYAAVRAACLRILRQFGPGPPTSPPGEAETAAARLELARLCTGHAWRLPGASLVILDDPAEFLQAALTPNLTDVPSLRRLLKAEGQQHRLGERRAEQEARRAEGGVGRSKATKDERQGRRDDAPAQSSGGDFKNAADLWPPVCVVNTLEHLTKHAPTTAKAFPARWLRSALPLPSLVRETSDQGAVEAALCGVLPFGLADAAFEAVAQTLAEQARESLAVADTQLIFGLNFSLERVIVACRPLSYLDMKQLCGRAGRTGRAAKAEVVFLEESAMRAAMVPPDPAALLASAGANFSI